MQFNDGWLVYYNYFKPHQSLNGKTPAEEAGIEYDVKNWADLTRMPVSKESEIHSHKMPQLHILKPKISLTRAFSRRRRRRSPRWVAPHRARHGVGMTRRSDR
jgi:hypothetical protein